MTISSCTVALITSDSVAGDGPLTTSNSMDYIPSCAMTLITSGSVAGDGPRALKTDDGKPLAEPLAEPLAGKAGTMPPASTEQQPTKTPPEFDKNSPIQVWIGQNQRDDRPCSICLQGTTLEQDGPDHLDCDAMRIHKHQMALITSDCSQAGGPTRGFRNPYGKGVKVLSPANIRARILPLSLCGILCLSAWPQGLCVYIYISPPPCAPLLPRLRVTMRRWRSICTGCAGSGRGRWRCLR